MLRIEILTVDKKYFQPLKTLGTKVRTHQLVFVESRKNGARDKELLGTVEIELRIELNDFDCYKFIKKLCRGKNLAKKNVKSNIT